MALFSQVLEARYLKSEFLQGHAPSEESWEGPFLAASHLLWLLAMVGVLGL